MKISVVIHGPEVIDSGEAKTVLEKLSRLGEVRAELGGTMGKAAVLDAGLENIIDITGHLKPSACIEAFFETADLICLLNRGKTFETGKVFGSKVSSRLKDREKKPLIQIECPGSSFGRIIPLNKKAGDCIEKLSRTLGIPAEEPLPFHNPVSIENCPKTGKTRIIREISGVLPGENIFVNGIVIGKSLSSKIRIVSENGFITAIEGGEIKEHGLEKLHNYEKRNSVNLEKAWIKSGDIRRNTSLLPDAKKQSTAYARKSGCSSLSGNGNIVSGKVVLIDHTAERTFELAAGAELAVTVGDDTTEIAGDILFRLGIPIIGITDGDCDEVACQTELFPGSVVIRLASGNDDALGRKIKQELLGGENSVVLEDICAFKENVIKLAEPLIEDIFGY
ncbi:DUF2117 domain-containing protein [Methanosarcina sp. MSH10X1]|uniref:DUF2117 family protein n=1 Tax=Methanosarcina sp. MSH10X1 TaxID=2507075 RepID=UPI000FFBB526|nr:DUF2117 domain-containing protein [Methanosarcina sp. MSH10X1]RXA17819.1 DUF2117 domain-containing protein [Methanosarcina sp. MSH10X1]